VADAPPQHVNDTALCDLPAQAGEKFASVRTVLGDTQPRDDRGLGRVQKGQQLRQVQRVLAVEVPRVAGRVAAVLDQRVRNQRFQALFGCVRRERGVAGFVRESVEYVFRQLPVWTNYFWMVYLRGSYTESCCPEYLKPDNFSALKAGLVDRISLHTSTVAELLTESDREYSKYVLLDHMDWMSSYHPRALAEEWALILERARADARIIFRSAHASPSYLERLEVGPFLLAGHSEAVVIH